MSFKYLKKKKKNKDDRRNNYLLIITDTYVFLVPYTEKQDKSVNVRLQACRLQR